MVGLFFDRRYLEFRAGGGPAQELERKVLIRSELDLLRSPVGRFGPALVRPVRWYFVRVSTYGRDHKEAHRQRRFTPSGFGVARSLGPHRGGEAFGARGLTVPAQADKPRPLGRDGRRASLGLRAFGFPQDPLPGPAFVVQERLEVAFAEQHPGERMKQSRRVTVQYLGERPYQEEVRDFRQEKVL